ncbi:hypothetical protein ALTERO38_51926 [Alteromonas sp. 38]|nr:hypothetical protein ALTER154_50301 [Alteromonas sp. 154]VXB92623.1 hypothetical protein ALTERO38_51926 [Alteromonas sp. 38]
MNHWLITKPITHSEFDQQMLPVNQREGMLESELENNRRNR